MVGWGAFGKMPALGDFFRLELGQGFVDPWDRWLQEGMTALRSYLGGRWNECFMTAPLWRFTLSAGLAGPEAMQGVLMPSVDRVGRQYPLTLAVALRGRPPVATSHFGASDSFRALEAIALDCLEDGMTRDDLGGRLRALVPPPSPRPARLQARPGQVAMSTGHPPGPVGALAGEYLGRSLRVPSLWSAELDGAERLLAVEGLPDPQQMAALWDIDAALWREEER